jgi:ferritin-like metal-binding protein YciE
MRVLAFDVTSAGPPFQLSKCSDVPSRGFADRRNIPRISRLALHQQSNIWRLRETNRPRHRVPSTQKDASMGLFTKDIKTMNDLFVHQLQDIYYAEKQLVKALPKMAEKATDKQLKQGFLTHLDETKTHVQRLEQVFQMHGAEAKAVNCPAIDGIIKEADEVAGEVEDKSVLDAALINAAQAAEHYEIVRYGSLIAWAKQLGRNDCAIVLQKTLDEEKATDKKLNTLAESKINLRAAS